MSDEKQKNRWCTEEEAGALHDLCFDFEDYFIRFNDGELSELEKSDFSARVYGLFCRDYFESNGDTSKIQPWVANYIAKKLFDALQGAPWNEIMDMPWDVKSSIFNKKGERAFDIYAGIENQIRGNPDLNITDLIAEQAKKHFISYETARGDYYAIKKMFKEKKLTEKFLKNS